MKKSNQDKDLHLGEHPGMPANGHWCIKVGQSVFDEGKGNDPAGAFMPHPGKLRAQPHIKINECDH